MQVRDGTVDDAPAIAAIGSAAVPRTYAGIFDQSIIDAIIEQTYSVEALRSCIAACAKEHDAHFLVAEDGGRVLGYLHYDAAGGQPELHRIYAAPDAIGKGVGSALIGELHHRLAPGTSYVLMVAADNDRAVRFYERHGFTVDAEVNGLAYYEERMGVAFPPDATPVPSVVMRYTVA